MANKKISDLISVSSYNLGDTFEIVNNTTSRKVSLQQLLNIILNGDVSINVPQNALIINSDKSLSFGNVSDTQTNLDIYSKSDTYTKSEIINLISLATSSFKNITNINYTILDDDGYSVIEITKTTSSGINTITLPTAADNIGRLIKIVLNQNSTGYADYLIIDGEGAETIGGNATIQMNGDNNSLTIVSNGTEWKILDFNISYSTAWINRNDWTAVSPGSNATLNTDGNVIHYLGAQQNKLLVKFYVSSTSSDTGSFEAIIDNTASSVNLGYSIFNIDSNNVRLYLGSSGISFINNAGAGAGTNLAAQSWYYKIVVTRTII